jgi:uncharacterized protein (TIGR00299 family) protein
MRALYLDAFSGISGDMTVGALLAVGVDFEHLRAELARLPLGHYALRCGDTAVHGIQARRFEVQLPAHAAAPHEHRAYADIRALIEKSALAARVRDTALAIFARLAAAESCIHGVPADAVSFHEVGAVDSIIDIVGTAIGLAALGVDTVFVSSLPLGSGLVPTRHGTMPVPAPATIELLRGFSVRFGDGTGELVTPTGAAIVATLARPNAVVPPLAVEAIGYGAGTRRSPDRPNVLRAVLGTPVGQIDADHLVEIATNIDDANPELYEHVFEVLFAAGARDVWLVPAHMKKNRPGVVLHVLCDSSARDLIAALVLRETSALGVRFHAVERRILARERIEVTTAYGTIGVKIARAPDGSLNVAPEYEDCRRAARVHNVPLKLVYQAATAAAVPRSTP